MKTQIILLDDALQIALIPETDIDNAIVEMFCEKGRRGIAPSINKAAIETSDVKLGVCMAGWCEISSLDKAFF